MAIMALSAGTFATWNGATYTGGPGAGTSGSPGVGDSLTIGSTGDLTIAASDNVDVGAADGVTTSTAAINVNGGTLRIQGAFRVRSAGIQIQNGGKVYVTDPSGNGYVITARYDISNTYMIREVGTTGVVIDVLGASSTNRIRMVAEAGATGSAGAIMASATGGTATWSLQNLSIENIAMSGADGGPKGLYARNLRLLGTTTKVWGPCGNSQAGTISTAVTNLPIDVSGLDLRNITWQYTNKGAKGAGVTRQIQNVTITGTSTFVNVAPDLTLGPGPIISNAVGLDLTTTTTSMYVYGVRANVTKFIFLASSDGSMSTRMVKTPIQAGNTFDQCIFAPCAQNGGLGVNFRGITEEGPAHQGIGRNYFTNSLIDSWDNGTVSDYYLGVGDREINGNIATRGFGNVSDGAGNFIDVNTLVYGVLFKCAHNTFLYSGGNPGTNYNYGAIGFLEQVVTNADLVRNVESNIFYNCTHGLCLSTQGTQTAGQKWTRQTGLVLRGNVTTGLQVDGGIPRPGGAGQSYLYRPTGEAGSEAQVCTTLGANAVTSRAGSVITVTGANFVTNGVLAGDLFYIGSALNPNGTAQKGWVIASVDSETQITLGDPCSGTTSADLPAATTAFLVVAGYWAGGGFYGSAETRGSLDVYEDPGFSDPLNAHLQAWAESIFTGWVQTAGTRARKIEVAQKIIDEMMKFNGTDGAGAAATFNSAWHPDNAIAFIKAKLTPTATATKVAASSYDPSTPYAGAVAPASSGTVTDVSVNPGSGTIAVGGTRTLTATVTGTGAFSTSVAWSSSNNAVASVSGGVVTGVSAGIATITARSVQNNTKLGTAIITVYVPGAGSSAYHRRRRSRARARR